MTDADAPPTGEPSPTAIDAALDTLREGGAQRVDPVRFRFIEALARRAATRDGAVRRVLDEKVARLLAAYQGEVDATSAARPAPGDAGRDTAPTRSALAELVELLARRQAAAASTPLPSTAGRTSTPPSPVDANELHYFRSTWSRLSADQRLAQARSALPENAGPLNSHHLVHRALTSMRELSPAYFERFVAQVDALAWIETANADGTAVPRPVPRTEPMGQSGRGRTP